MGIEYVSVVTIMLVLVEIAKNKQLNLEASGVEG